ncbi:MAG TPA: hypothetical protein DCS93_19680 [Microscillaceae bacterium]|nr:hypothetical protein [Microscillaceae bacterium]
MTKKISQVLLVDDDKQSLRLLLDCMLDKPEEYQPMTALDATAAIKILQYTTPDLLITDWDMPHFNGIELIKYLRSHPTTKDVPAIIVTGINTTPENLQYAFDAGANDYIAKPLNKVELYARANAAIQMYRDMQTIQEQYRVIEDQKNRELSTKIIELNQNKRLIKRLCKELLDLTQQSEVNLKHEVRSIVRKTENDLSLDNAWDSFKVHFEKVHPHFFSILQKAFPNLSVVDMRHCAYIKIGLSNKEIAQILNISAQSVVKQHYRIKKKMELPSEQTLNEAILRVK